MAKSPSTQVLNARYIAIRTAEARGLEDRLLQAARDRTPGVRRLLVPLLYRFWHRQREKGWIVLAALGKDIMRFPGIPNSYATETFAEVSLAILNGCRDDSESLQRLASIWRQQVENIFASPLARLFGHGLMMRLLARPVAHVLQRQPAYQPLNFKELQVAFSHEQSYRGLWHQALVCLEQPEVGLDKIVSILERQDLPFDLYLALLGERTFVYHGVNVDRAGVINRLDHIFYNGCPWFRQSVVYTLFHVLGRSRQVADGELEHYVKLTKHFFSHDRQMRTAVADYDFATHLAWPEIVAEQHRPGSGPRLVPELLRQAIEEGNEGQVKGIFAAIDAIAFVHHQTPLALKMLEQSIEIGGSTVRERVLKSLATARLRDERLVDAFLEEHKHLSRLRDSVEGVEPAVYEEDMPTMMDGLTVSLLLNSDHFRARLVDAFRHAAAARSVAEFLVQILAWMRNEF